MVAAAAGFIILFTAIFIWMVFVAAAGFIFGLVMNLASKKLFFKFLPLIINIKCLLSLSIAFVSTLWIGNYVGMTFTVIFALLFFACLTLVGAIVGILISMIIYWPIKWIALAIKSG